MPGGVSLSLPRARGNTPRSRCGRRRGRSWQIHVAMRGGKASDVPRPHAPGHGNASAGSPAATPVWNLPRAGRAGTGRSPATSQAHRCAWARGLRTGLTARGLPTRAAGPRGAHAWRRSGLQRVCTAARQASRGHAAPPTRPSLRSEPSRRTELACGRQQPPQGRLVRGSEGGELAPPMGPPYWPRAGPRCPPPSPCAGGDRHPSYRRASPVADGQRPRLPSRDHAGQHRPGSHSQHGFRHAWLPRHTEWRLPGPACPGPLPLARCASGPARRHPKRLRPQLVRAQPRPSTTLALAPRCVGGTIGLGGGWPPGRAPGTILPLGFRRPAGGRGVRWPSVAPLPGTCPGPVTALAPCAGPTWRDCRRTPPSLPLSPTTSGHRPGGAW